MNKLQKWIMIVMMLTLVACGNSEATNDTNNENKSQETIEEVIITLQITDQTTETVIVDSDYTVKEGTDLLTLIEENFDQVEVDNGFLTSIEGHEQQPDHNEYWLYQVNGEDGTVGMAEYQLMDQDEITLNLAPLE